MSLSEAEKKLIPRYNKKRIPENPPAYKALDFQYIRNDTENDEHVGLQITNDFGQFFIDSEIPIIVLNAQRTVANKLDSHGNLVFPDNPNVPLDIIKGLGFFPVCNPAKGFYCHPNLGNSNGNIYIHKSIKDLDMFERNMINGGIAAAANTNGAHFNLYDRDGNLTFALNKPPLKILASWDYQWRYNGDHEIRIDNELVWERGKKLNKGYDHYNNTNRNDNRYFEIRELIHHGNKRIAAENIGIAYLTSAARNYYGNLTTYYKEINGERFYNYLGEYPAFKRLENNNLILYFGDDRQWIISKNRGFYREDYIRAFGYFVDITQYKKFHSEWRKENTIPWTS